MLDWILNLYPGVLDPRDLRVEGQVTCVNSELALPVQWGLLIHTRQESRDQCSACPMAPLPMAPWQAAMSLLSRTPDTLYKDFQADQ